METARTAVFNAKNQHLAALIDTEVTKLRDEVTAQEQGLATWIAKETALKERENKKEAQCMESMYWQKQQVLDNLANTKEEYKRIIRTKINMAAGTDVSIDSRHPSLSRILANMRYQIIVLELLRDDYLMRLRIVSGQCELYATYRVGTHRLPEDVLLYSTTAGEAKCLHIVSTLEKMALLRAHNCIYPHSLPSHHPYLPDAHKSKRQDKNLLKDDAKGDSKDVLKEANDDPALQLPNDDVRAEYQAMVEQEAEALKQYKR